MNILLIDDHALFRAGLRLLLADLSDDLRFFEAASCAEAQALLRAQRIDIILLDFHLPGLHGSEALRALRAESEEATIVVLSAEDDPAMIRRIIDESAAGFIPKATSHAVMIAALRLILAGGTYLPPHALHAAHPRPQPSAATPDSTLAGLTERQLTTLRLAMRGKSNKSIAQAMDISEATVKAHLSAAFRALDVRNRTEAVFAAARLGLPLNTAD